MTGREQGRSSLSLKKAIHRDPALGLMQHLHVEQRGRVERHAGLAEDDEALVQAICRQPTARQNVLPHHCLLLDVGTDLIPVCCKAASPSRAADSMLLTPSTSSYR